MEGQDLTTLFPQFLYQIEGIQSPKKSNKITKFKIFPSQLFPYLVLPLSLLQCGPITQPHQSLSNTKELFSLLGDLCSSYHATTSISIQHNAFKSVPFRFFISSSTRKLENKNDMNHKIMHSFTFCFNSSQKKLKNIKHKQKNVKS
jgi:hypothetical protein